MRLPLHCRILGLEGVEKPGLFYILALIDAPTFSSLSSPYEVPSGHNVEVLKSLAVTGRGYDVRN